MRDLTAWLRPLIEARKATAEKATPGDWELDGGSITNGHPVDQIVDWVYESADGEHIVLNQPRDVIAQCEADLLTLDEHAPVDHGCLGVFCATCSGPGEISGDPEGDPYPCLTVRLVAWGYRFRDLAGYARVAGGWAP